MRVFIGKKLVLEEQKGTTVRRAMQKLMLLDEEYLPYNPLTGLPTTPDYRIPDDGDIFLLPVMESAK